MKLKKIFYLVFVVLIIIFVAIIIKYNYECYNYQSTELQDKNLKGFVKKIISNNIDLSTNNLEIYDKNQNLLMYTNTSISMGNVFSENIKKSLILNNYLICKYETDSFDKSNYEYFFASKKSELLNTINIDLKENEEWTDYNISERDYLKVQMTKNDKIIKIYEVDENFDTSDYYCFIYEKNIEKEIDCKTSKINVKIEFKNNEKILATRFSNNFDNKRNFQAKSYYQNGLEVKNKIYDIDGVCWQFTNNIFDNNRNLIQSKTYIDISKSQYQKSELEELISPSKDSSIKFEYKYDNNNNWITKTSKNNSGKLKNIKRKIEYYNFVDYIKNIL